ncbi:MAG TPA: cytochrome c biogenesis protein CcsA [Thermoanaerobaculales bacterium]|nr:cytochrome c biogenesis protein CcsA [Thermoanaerobaculales bacterium]HQL29618.1 cytochrome c biogenesis protein CcsA [Thermoanaerobaculales bacterium]HQN97667.1 cytochrome c biogenesis protein CcsA [Thermoanaerobaculales bacterium]
MNIRELLKWVLLLWMSLVIWAAFLYVPPADKFIGESSRIVFFHVPTAWVSVVAFLISCVASVLYLRRREPQDDIRAAVAAGLGLLFAILATVTGAVFARIMWGAYWNWDPRQTSIVILMLIYASYFALRGAVPDPERRAALAAVYAILAFVTVPFLVFVVPRIYWSLHPDSIINTRGANEFDSRHTQVLMASLAGFTGLFVWLYSVAVRVETIRRRRQQEAL